MTLVNITEVLQATSLPPVTQVPVGAANGDSKWDMMGIDFIFLIFLHLPCIFFLKQILCGCSML